MPLAARRVLVVSACSKRKTVGNPAAAAAARPFPARKRYTGRAHLRVRDAVDHWRDDGSGELIEWSIVSAGLGLVDEHDPVPHYDATFVGLGDAAARERGYELGLPDALRDRLSDADVALFVLPLVYLRAVGAPFSHPPEQLYFASPAFRAQDSAVAIVHCGTEDALELGVSAREVAAARFESFVSDAITSGLHSALMAWGLREPAK
ncbi:MAG: hypothetical protein OXC71_03230 [Chloroflexi bacterium]|nr:hypothetical protein [Chloroflexota bacterium]